MENIKCIIKTLSFDLCSFVMIPIMLAEWIHKYSKLINPLSRICISTIGPALINPYLWLVIKYAYLYR